MKSSRGVLLSILLVPLGCLVALPFYYILVNTLKTQAETASSPLALPSSLYLDNYIDVFQRIPVLQSFANTLYVTVLSIAVMLLVGSMAAYGVLLGKGRLATIVGVVLVIAFVVPGQATLIPLYRMLAGLELVDTLNGLVIMYACGSIFCYFLIIGYMRSLPTELFEAARIDGAGSFRIYWSIALPLIRPILVTVGVFQTMWVWNDFITPNVFINSPEKQTLVLQVYTAVGQFTTNWPVFMTLTVIVLIPMVVFFLFAQRQIVSGLVNGGVKG
ncbi:carbohydrate ABC transporter membrane protein 2 (CUT1 family) [Microbacterium sp. AG790]|uniref:carbohydrate ABC transporter permease n=1 Tax=Microbacterium sp. AG790 TaxID=2183995 RepID=UPI000EB5470E|nr:carbohydrate ABC transporter permease [Microbacterium sp. AG790]RKS90046.1 carbohydrate ABC transporter membrane protein 2 (CUT1 family) [Microbacterium sp. AG790]